MPAALAVPAPPAAPRAPTGTRNACADGVRGAGDAPLRPLLFEKDIARRCAHTPGEPSVRAQCAKRRKIK